MIDDFLVTNNGIDYGHGASRGSGHRILINDISCIRRIDYRLLCNK